MSSESTIIYNTSNSIGFSSFEGNNKNSNSKNYKTTTKKNLDTILEKKGEKKYVSNNKILKKIQKETGKEDFYKDSVYKKKENVQVENTNIKFLLHYQKKKKNSNIICSENINNKKIVEIKKAHNNFIKENNNDEKNKNILQIYSDSLNTNKHSSVSKKIFDDEDMNIQKGKRHTKKEKNLPSSKKNERYQNSSESGSFSINEALIILIKKLDIVISQNQAIMAHFNIKIEEAKSSNKNLNK